MVQMLKLWIREVNRKKNLRTLLKTSFFPFYIGTDKQHFIVRTENDILFLDEKKSVRTAIDKTIKGKEEIFISILSGERKLREAVKKQELDTTFSFRELLLLESLFYLARPNVSIKTLSKL